jgi:hypothetical protein
MDIPPLISNRGISSNQAITTIEWMGMTGTRLGLMPVNLTVCPAPRE